MKTDCNVQKATVEAAFDDYTKRYGTDLERFKKVKINFEEKDSLWRLWILALMYQAMSETASETVFANIPLHGLTFNPSGISKKSEECGCPLLLRANKVQFCNLTMSSECSKHQYFKDCPVPIVRDEIRRLTRIARAIVSSAIFLRDYDFSLESLYGSLRERPVDERTQRMLDMFIVMGGEKVSHMCLRWISNSVPTENWELNTKGFLAIDRNIKRVAQNIGLCKSSSTSVIRAHLNLLLDTLDMNNPKDAEKLEIALLHVGQEYCNETRQNGCKQTKCPFYHANESPVNKYG